MTTTGSSDSSGGVGRARREGHIAQYPGPMAGGRAGHQGRADPLRRSQRTSPHRAVHGKS